MKISKQALKTLIAEEIAAVLKEDNPYYNTIGHMLRTFPPSREAAYGHEIVRQLQMMKQDYEDEGYRYQLRLLLDMPEFSDFITTSGGILPDDIRADIKQTRGL